MIFHFLSQWRFSECETEPKSFFQKLKQGQYNFWVIHWWLMTSYSIMFLLVVFLLAWFQADEIYPWWHPQRLLGYYATGGLIIGTIYFYIKRIKKNDEKSKFSHASDWTFIILLFLTALTGIIMHIFRVNESPVLWTYYAYLIHLMVAIPMLVIEVPFTKWTHLAYRPLAIYFDELKNHAKN
jgi:hypothetical protein